ncbi:MAG: hypothetical protein ACI8SE_001438, partial [Bacteroidia bacterium]
AFYIMDGHHRAASISNLYSEYGTEEKRYCMTYLLDCNQLKINPFHRIVESDAISEFAVLEKLSEEFWVEEIPDYAVRPEQSGEFILKCSEGSYRLRLKSMVELLDVQELEGKVLASVFGITDSRSDDRISFISTEDELTEAVVRAQSPHVFLFMLHPCTFEEIALVSDNNEVMPPKSTFVEPKCDAGLFMQPYGSSS